MGDNMIKASKECSLMTPNMTFQTIVQFFGDGLFTYSEAVTGIIRLLAVYPDVQDRLVEELEITLEGKEEISHGDIGNMSYMDQVINEGMLCVPSHTPCASVPRTTPFQTVSSPF